MKKIVLVGAGHSHLEIIQALTLEQTSADEIILISPEENTYYSGAIPRFISGDLRIEQLTINSALYAQAKGVKFIQGSVVSADLNQKLLTLDSGQSINYDVLSLNVGGTPTKIQSKSSPYRTIYLKPFSAFMQNWKEVQKNCISCHSPNFVVIGGGAAAFETAIALKNRLVRFKSFNGQVHIVSKGIRLCDSYSSEISAALLQSAQRLRISVHLAENITRIEDSFVKLKDGSQLKFDYIFIATQTEASSIRIVGNSVEFRNGFPVVDSYLQLAKDAFGSGDGVVLKGHDRLPKSGVVAVHEGRHLYNSIMAAIHNQKLEEFRVPRRLLNILITGDQRARAVWGEFSFEGQCIAKVKSWIDEGYVKKFKS